MIPRRWRTLKEEEELEKEEALIRAKESGDELRFSFFSTRTDPKKLREHYSWLKTATKRSGITAKIFGSSQIHLVKLSSQLKGVLEEFVHLEELHKEGITLSDLKRKPSFVVERIVSDERQESDLDFAFNGFRYSKRKTEHFIVRIPMIFLIFAWIKWPEDSDVVCVEYRMMHASDQHPSIYKSYVYSKYNNCFTKGNTQHMAISFLTTNIIAYTVGIFVQRSITYPPSVIFLVLSSYIAIQGPALYVANWASLVRLIMQVLFSVVFGLAGFILSSMALKIDKFIKLKGDWGLVFSSFVAILMCGASMVLYDIYGMTLGLLGSGFLLLMSTLAFFGFNSLALNSRDQGMKRYSQQKQEEELDSGKFVVPTMRFLIEFCGLWYGGMFLTHVLQAFVLFPAFATYPEEFTSIVQALALLLMSVVFYFIYNREAVKEKARKLKQKAKQRKESKSVSDDVTV